MTSLIELERTVEEHSRDIADHTARIENLEKDSDRVMNKLDKLIWLILAVLAEVPIMVVV